jgi:hypothetical protein
MYFGLPLFSKLGRTQNEMSNPGAVNGWIRNHWTNQNFQLGHDAFRFVRIFRHDREGTDAFA